VDLEHVHSTKASFFGEELIEKLILLENLHDSVGYTRLGIDYGPPASRDGWQS
jgi:hypothetical protein